jgi:hypothetical protein
MLLVAAGCGPTAISNAVGAAGGSGGGAGSGGAAAGSGGAAAGSGGAAAGSGGSAGSAAGADAGVDAPSLPPDAPAGGDTSVDAPSLPPDAPSGDVPSEHPADAAAERASDAAAEARDASASNGDAKGDVAEAGGDAAVPHPRYLDSLTLDNKNVFPIWVAVGADGATYLVGSFDKRTDFDPTTATDYRDAMGNMDVFITKLNPDGTRAWTKTISGSGSTASVSASAIAVTNDSIFVTGQLAGTIDFDPGAGTASKTGTNTTSYVLRLTTDGAFGWVGLIPNANVGDSCWVNHQLVAGSDGSLYTGVAVSGTCDVDPGPAVSLQTTASGGKGLLLKLSQTDGHLIWSRGLAGDACYSGVNGLTIALDGKVWIGVGVGGQASCTLGTVDSGTSGGTIYASLTPAGALQGSWLLSGSVNPMGLAAATDGSVYAAGGFSNTVDFDPGTGVVNRTALSGSDGFLLKLAADGTHRWVRTMAGRDNYVAVAATPNGGAIALGGVDGTPQEASIGFHVDAFAADSTLTWTFPLMGKGIYPVTDITTPTGFVVSGNNDNFVDLDPGPNVHGANNGAFVAFYAY